MHTLIGLPCGRDRSHRRHQLPLAAVPFPYVSALQQVGGAPILIPLFQSEGALERITGLLGGILLTGGGDVNPARYGAKRRPETDNVDDERDRTELWLTRRAVEHDIPLLAICRGMQVLNVACGGTLYQDLRAEWAEAGSHARFHPGYPLDDRAHEIQLLPNSRLAGIIGREAVMVNSRHHQAVRQLGKQLVVCATARDDDVIEAIEMPGRHFVLGVQWHPENLIESEPSMLRIFASFVDAAGR